MSKIGQRKIQIPQGVKAEAQGEIIKVTGPKGEQSVRISPRVNVKISENEIAVERAGNDKKARALHGLTRQLLFNAVSGTSEGFQKKLDYKGVGFKAEVSGDKLILNLGFSHPCEVKAPLGIEFKVEKNVITVSGIDKQKVGQVAADIRSLKPVEPYKGKGIKYIDEVPRRKPGKAAKAAVGGGAAA